jgi:arylsulfatase A-like enzyme
MPAILWILCLWALGGCASNTRGVLSDSTRAPRSEAPQRPNVIVILADDLGYGDLTVQGNTHVSTPNIDSIAAHGVRFTNGYVAAPVCSPSRAGLLSGRYPQRFGHEFNPGGRPRATNPIFERLGLPTDQVLLPQLMKDAGYATGMVGKWHLGYAPQFLPQARGFDEFFGFLTGAHAYLGAEDASDDGELPAAGEAPRAAPRNRIRALLTAAGANPIYRGTEPVVENEYLTDAFGREAVDFIDRHQEKPFFLYVAFNAVHAPLQAAQRYLDRVSGLDDPRETYAAMTVALDDAVGRILTKLDDTKLTGRTVVVFLSDNGGVFRPNQRNYADNGPLHAGKLFVHEGGTRIPFMIQWPGHIEPGTVYRRPVSSMDILPTALAIARGTPPADRPMDGVDLLPYLSGKKKGAPHEFLAWRLGQNHALRKGDWKILQYGDNPAKLFNLKKDIGETKDLALASPKKLNELSRLYATWESEMIAPVYKAKTPIPLVYEGEQITLDY